MAQARALRPRASALGRRLLCVAVAGSFAAGCADDPAPSQQRPGDAGAEAAAGDLCPDPANERVHYRDEDPNACRSIVLDCTTEQNGFDNACGCGCIDKGSPLCPPVEDPAITFISRDPAACGAKLPVCPTGDRPFNTTCGCGCTRPGG